MKQKSVSVTMIYQTKKKYIRKWSNEFVELLSIWADEDGKLVAECWIVMNMHFI